MEISGKRADIRDRDALRPIIERHRPEIVFHAPALKRLPMLEQYQEDGWKTNVLGTLNVLQLTAEFGVRQFVNISTDKAANPTSVLGKTKRITDQLTAWHGRPCEGTYLSVRFENVPGSRGSMMHAFRHEIDMGEPITVTHPEIMRYYMTIPGASELVILAATIGRDADVLVLDMGSLSTSRTLQSDSSLTPAGKPRSFSQISGPNEKMREAPFGRHDSGERSHHPLISHVAVPPLSTEMLDGLLTADLTPTSSALETRLSSQATGAVL